MLVKFDRPLLNLEKEVLKEGEKEVQLKTVCINGLMAEMQKFQDDSGEKKAKRYKLAMAIAEQPEVELSAEEISLIKERVSAAFGALIVGQALDMLEGK